MDLDNSLSTKVAHSHNAAVNAAKPLAKAVSNFLLAKGPAFSNLFAARVRLIMSRNPSPEEFELTIFDRVLLAVTANGTDLDSAAPVVFFLRHYYNFDLSVFYIDEAVPVLDRELAVIDSEPEAGSEQSLPGVPSSADQVQSSPTRVGEIASSSAPVTNLDSTLQRLLDTYEKACTEYLAVEKQRDESTLKAAKWLRDTAENAIVYLNETNIGAEKLDSIRIMSETVKGVVQDLSGGKVRKWDEGYQVEAPKEMSRRKARSAAYWRGRGRGRQATTSERPIIQQPEVIAAQARRRSRSPARRHEYHHRPDDHFRRPEQGINNPYGSTFKHHAEAYPPRNEPYPPPYARGYPTNRPEERYENIRERPSYPDDRSYNRRDEYNVRDYRRPSPPPSDHDRYDPRRRTERDSTHAVYVSEKQKMKGRGHSGIPYGYSDNRDVDSYKPGRS